MSLPGLTRTAALKSEVSQLKTNNGGLIELYWQLKHGSVSDAYAIVEQIRSEERFIDIPFPANESSRGTYGMPVAVSGTAESSAGAASVRNRQLSDTTASLQSVNESKDTHGSSRQIPRAFFEDRMAEDSRTQGSTATLEDTSTGLSQLSEGGRYAHSYSKNSDALLRYSLQHNMDKIRHGFEVQQLCIGEIFCCHELDAFEDLFAGLDADRHLPASSALICEMCAVAVTSGQYARESIKPDILDYWYDAARRYFDDCIETSPASATKVSALLGLCNLLNKSTVAIVYFETGLALAARYLQKHVEHQDNIRFDELFGVVRTQRSMAFCNGWLQATLGYIPPTTACSVFSEESVLPFAREHDLVRGAVTAIAILKATVMQTLWVCSDVSDLLVSIRSLQDQLQSWYDRLPYEARLSQLGTDAHLPLKTSVYYLHLLHLGAVMLIFRHCLAGFQSSGDREALSLEQKSLMYQALDDGLLAAQQSARMVYMIRQASHSVRHCWLTIYQAYVSGMILIYHATRLKIAGCSEARCATDSGLAEQVIDVLNFCKEQDPVALEFVASLSHHYEQLQGIDAKFPGTADRFDTSVPRPDSYLFSTWCSSTPLQETSEELSRQLCNPYAGESATARQEGKDADQKFDPSGMLETRWTPREEFGCSPLGCQTVRGAMTPMISNLEDGYFVDSSEPSWWLAKRSCVAYSSEATALKGL